MLLLHTKAPFRSCWGSPRSACLPPALRFLQEPLCKEISVIGMGEQELLPPELRCSWQWGVGSRSPAACKASSFLNVMSEDGRFWRSVH